MPPQVIGPYRVKETLGSGGVGTVYRAVDRRSGEDVALKLLSTGPALDPKAARRLAREFETLADLSHPNIVKVFDTGVHRGYPYLAMELVEGLTLRHYLDMATKRYPTQQLQALFNRAHATGGDGEPLTQSEEVISGLPAVPFNLSSYAEEIPSDYFDYESGPESVKALARAADEPDTDVPFSNQVLLPFDPATESLLDKASAPKINLEELSHPARIGRLKDAMIQLSQALAYIHAHGLVHRDLKPSNVMVDEEGQVRLMDFGLAKFLADDSAVTANGKMVGTFRYMAPEQLLGEPVDARADLYSFGVILYEMLAGVAPFEAPTPYELWQKILELEAEPVQNLNPRADLGMSRVALRLLRKEPRDRYQTAEEVTEALNE